MTKTLFMGVNRSGRIYIATFSEGSNTKVQASDELFDWLDNLHMSLVHEVDAYGCAPDNPILKDEINMLAMAYRLLST
jgi:hypothetical protein